jgi:hypothetical protein
MDISIAAAVSTEDILVVVCRVPTVVIMTFLVTLLNLLCGPVLETFCGLFCRLNFVSCCVLCDHRCVRVKNYHLGTFLTVIYMVLTA